MGKGKINVVPVNWLLTTMSLYWIFTLMITPDAVPNWALLLFIVVGGVMEWLKFPFKHEKEK